MYTLRNIKPNLTFNKYVLATISNNDYLTYYYTLFLFDGVLKFVLFDCSQQDKTQLTQHQNQKQQVSNIQINIQTQQQQKKKKNCTEVTYVILISSSSLRNQFNPNF